MEDDWEHLADEEEDNARDTAGQAPKESPRIYHAREATRRIIMEYCSQGTLFDLFQRRMTE